MLEPQHDGFSCRFLFVLSDGEAVPPLVSLPFFLRAAADKTAQVDYDTTVWRPYTSNVVLHLCSRLIIARDGKNRVFFLSTERLYDAVWGNHNWFV